MQFLSVEAHTSAAGCHYPVHLLKVDIPASCGEAVYLIHHEDDIRLCLAAMLQDLGMRTICFRSAADYLHSQRTDVAACLVLDTDLPDIHLLGLEAQGAEKSHPPFVVISGNSDVSAVVKAMKSGAMEFLTMPIDPGTLLSSIRIGFAQDRKLRQRRAELTALRARFSKLTAREREVFALIAGGLLNKQVAYSLGISCITVQIHRGQVMRKMEAESFAELIRFAVKLRIPAWSETRTPAARALIA